MPTKLPSNITLRVAGMGKAMAKLADSVHHWVLVRTDPSQVKSLAKAKAAARVTMARADAQVRSIKARAKRRVESEQIREQQNIEAIVADAASQLPPDASDEPVDPDWMNQFFDECKNVSHETMRGLFAKVLAGEVVSPGTFSRRTLTVLRGLSPDEADTFDQLCRYVWTASDGDAARSAASRHFIPVIRERSDRPRPPYAYADLVAAMSAGLTHAGLLYSIGVDGSWDISFGGRDFSVRQSGQIHCAALTRQGEDLYYALGREPDYSVIPDVLASMAMDHVHLEPRGG